MTKVVAVASVAVVAATAGLVVYIVREVSQLLDEVWR